MRLGPPVELLETLGPFNSLFEMRGSAFARRGGRAGEGALSILYLRCRRRRSTLACGASR